MNRKILLLIILLLPLSVSAKKEKVYLDKCIDGDTISVIDKNKNIYKVRFLAVDSPEIDKDEPYANEAKEFTCNLLSKSKNIYLEKDKNADEEDKYERKLRWVWADESLVQSELINNGYAKIFYLYDDYKYTKELYEFEKHAKDEKIHIWSDEIPHNEVTKLNKVQKKKKLTLMDKLNKYFDLIAIIIGMLLALLTMRVKKKDKSKK